MLRKNVPNMRDGASGRRVDVAGRRRISCHGGGVFEAMIGARRCQARYHIRIRNPEVSLSNNADGAHCVVTPGERAARISYAVHNQK